MAPNPNTIFPGSTSGGDAVLAGATAGSIFGPIGTAVGATLGFFAAAADNQNKKEAQRERDRLTRQEIRFARDRRVFLTDQTAKAAQAQVGQQSVRLNSAGSGRIDLIANIASTGAASQQAINAEADATIFRLQTQRRLGAQATNASLQNEALAALSGGMNGFAVGNQIDNLIKQKKDNDKLGEIKDTGFGIIETTGQSALQGSSEQGAFLTNSAQFSEIRRGNSVNQISAGNDLMNFLIELFGAAAQGGVK